MTSMLNSLKGNFGKSDLMMPFSMRKAKTIRRNSSAQNIAAKIPITKVTRNTRIGPVPNQTKILATSSVVMLASSTVVKKKKPSQWPLRSARF
jgi:hypothetical protein